LSLQVLRQHTAMSSQQLALLIDRFLVGHITLSDRRSRVGLHHALC
jgi:hypothetical protein